MWGKYGLAVVSVLTRLMQNLPALLTASNKEAHNTVVISRLERQLILLQATRPTLVCQGARLQITAPLMAIHYATRNYHSRPLPSPSRIRLRSRKHKSVE